MTRNWLPHTTHISHISHISVAIELCHTRTHTWIGRTTTRTLHQFLIRVATALWWCRSMRCAIYNSKPAFCCLSHVHILNVIFSLSWCSCCRCHAPLCCWYICRWCCAQVSRKAQGSLGASGERARASLRPTARCVQIVKNMCMDIRAKHNFWYISRGEFQSR